MIGPVLQIMGPPPWWPNFKIPPPLTQVLAHLCLKSSKHGFKWYVTWLLSSFPFFLDPETGILDFSYGSCEPACQELSFDRSHDFFSDFPVLFSMLRNILIWPSVKCFAPYSNIAHCAIFFFNLPHVLNQAQYFKMIHCGELCTIKDVCSFVARGV